jgi:hypothetical protein
MMFLKQIHFVEKHHRIQKVLKHENGNGSFHLTHFDQFEKKRDWKTRRYLWR